MNLALVDQGKNIKNVMDNYIDLILLLMRSVYKY